MGNKSVAYPSLNKATLQSRTRPIYITHSMTYIFCGNLSQRFTPSALAHIAGPRQRSRESRIQASERQGGRRYPGLSGGCSTDAGSGPIDAWMEIELPQVIGDFEGIGREVTA